MSDLIERLERWGRDEGLQNHFIGSRSAREDCAEAAAALAEAEAEIARLRELLGGMVDVLDDWPYDSIDDQKAHEVAVKAARAELSRPHATKGEAG